MGSRVSNALHASCENMHIPFLLISLRSGSAFVQAEYCLFGGQSPRHQRKTAVLNTCFVLNDVVDELESFFYSARVMSVVKQLFCFATERGILYHQIVWIFLCDARLT